MSSTLHLKAHRYNNCALIKMSYFVPDYKTSDFNLFNKKIFNFTLSLTLSDLDRISFVFEVVYVYT